MITRHLEKSNIKGIKQRNIKEELRGIEGSAGAEKKKSFKSIIDNLRETSNIHIHLKEQPQNNIL